MKKSPRRGAFFYCFFNWEKFFVKIGELTFRVVKSTFHAISIDRFCLPCYKGREKVNLILFIVDRNLRNISFYGGKNKDEYRPF